MIREIILEAGINPKAISYKGGSIDDDKEIMGLISKYDRYTERIESYKQQLKAEQKNKTILASLKKLGVKEFIVDKKTYKI